MSHVSTRSRLAALREASRLIWRQNLGPPTSRVSAPMSHMCNGWPAGIYNVLTPSRPFAGGSCITPSAYAQAVLADSQVPSGQSRYAASHLGGLARYLHQAFEARSPSVTRANNTWNNVSPDVGNNEPKCFVSICDLDPSTSERTQHINSIVDFEKKADSFKTSSSGHIVFLKGYPSPPWLLSIGAKYQVDPEFFQRHLGFRAGPRKLYSHPHLPSTARNIFKLRYTTVGASVSTARTEDKRSTLKLLRAENRSYLEAFKEKLASAHELAPGDAIVRETSIHDLKHFSIEQDISVHLTSYHESWVGEWDSNSHPS